MNKLIYLTAGIILTFSCSRCKEECTDSTNPECPNYEAPADPCAGKTEVSADFVIEERLTALAFSEWITTDTTLNERTVGFRANFQDADSYKWYIGSQTFDTPFVSRYFTEQWAGFDIPITLVVRKTPNNQCFPNDDGYDSLTKVFHVSHYLIEPDPTGDPDRTIEHGGLQGTYRFIAPGMSDSIDVNVSFCNNYLGRTILLENADGQGTICNCDTLNNPGGAHLRKWSYRYAEFGEGNDPIAPDFCNSLEGILERRINGEAYLTIESRIRPAPGAAVIYTSYNYKGRRIH